MQGNLIIRIRFARVGASPMRQNLRLPEPPPNPAVRAA
jgi:hypothetical protein